MAIGRGNVGRSLLRPNGSYQVYIPTRAACGQPAAERWACDAEEQPSARGRLRLLSWSRKFKMKNEELKMKFHYGFELGLQPAEVAHDC